MRRLSYVVTGMLVLACGARSTVPAPPPLFLTLDSALGYTIGMSGDEAREVARTRDQALHCAQRSEIRICTPRIIVGDPGYYTVILRNDTVTRVSTQLRAWPQVGREELERYLDRISLRRASGPMTPDGRGRITIWTDDAWERQAIMICDTRPDELLCDLSIGDTYARSVVQNRVAKIIERAAAYDSIQTEHAAAAAAVPDSALPAYTTPFVLLVSPDSQEIAALQGRLGEDFFVVADDAMWYRSLAYDLLERLDMPHAEVTRGSARFLVHGELQRVSWENAEWSWFAVVYDGRTAPIITPDVSLSSALQ